MSVAWQAEQERGSRLAIRMMAWLALRFGRAAARALLPPICLYYLARSSRSNQAIRRFYGRALNREATWQDLYRHYHCFAATILDRVYFLRGRFELFDVRVQGLDALDPVVKEGRGCLLLGSHVGSFEAVRALGLARAGLEIRVLMDEHNAPLIREVTRELNPAIAETVIQIGEAASMLEVKECLNRGGVVGVMGDRLVQRDQAVISRFLGSPASFPSGAIRLAHVMRAPVVLFFGLYRGSNRYDVYLETFSDEVRLSADSWEEDLQRLIQRYADRLADYSRQAPDNWFNFYDFWDERS